MKTRKGFVSNSSSSSFILDGDGEPVVIDSEDWGYSFFCCENEHVIEIYTMETHIIEELNEMLESQEIESDAIPSKYCSFCQHKAVSYHDAIQWLLKKAGLNSINSVQKKLLTEFESREQLQSFLKGEP